MINYIFLSLPRYIFPCIYIYIYQHIIIDHDVLYVLFS